MSWKDEGDIVALVAPHYDINFASQLDDIGEIVPYGGNEDRK